MCDLFYFKIGFSIQIGRFDVGHSLLFARGNQKQIRGEHLVVGHSEQHANFHLEMAIFICILVIRSKI